MPLTDFLQRGRLEAGCDEAGRGCIAGPVFAAAVVLPQKGFYHPLLDDSKQMSAKNRACVRDYIREHALSWAVAWLSAREIDSLNILRASIAGMHRALEGLQADRNAPGTGALPLSGVVAGGRAVIPDFILVDGNRFYPYQKIEYRCFVKGDGRFTAIAAASVLAKTFRDAYMQGLALRYPAYGWAQNKGYPTLYHRKMLRALGPTEYHRRSFRLHEEQTDTLFE